MSDENKVSAEDLALLKEVKGAFKESDPVKLRELAMKSGWNEQASEQRLNQFAQNYEATEAAKHGMSVEQYRYARQMEEQQAAMQNGGYPQPNFGYGIPNPQQQQWQPNPMYQAQHQGHAASGHGQLPNPEMRKIIGAVDTLKNQQGKEISELKKQIEQQKYEKQMSEYQRYVGNVFSNLKPKLKGLENEDENMVVNTVIAGLQQAVASGKKDATPESVLADMNNAYATRINTVLERQTGNKEKNLPLYEFPKKEVQVPTLNAQSTAQGANGIQQGQQQQQQPKGKLAPKGSLAEGTAVIEEEVVKSSDETEAQAGLKPSQLSSVRAIVEKDLAIQDAEDDAPIGQVNADGVDDAAVQPTA